MKSKVGQRVRVTYEGTITAVHEDDWLIVRDGHGANHHGVRPEYAEIITPPPPYVDGTLYADRAGTRLYYRADGYKNGPGWSYSPNSPHVYPYGNAQRPLRRVIYGDEIQE